MNQSNYHEKKIRLANLIEREKFKEALAYLKTIEIDENDIEMYMMRSIIVSSSGDFHKAIKILEKGLAIEPNHPELMYSLGYLYKQIGEIEKSTKHFEAVTKLSDFEEKKVFESPGKNVQISELMELGKKIKCNVKELIDNKEYLQAEALIEEFLSIMPVDEEILFYQSEIMVRVLINEKL